MKILALATLILGALSMGDHFQTENHFHTEKYFQTENFMNYRQPPYVFNQDALPFNPQFWTKPEIQGLPPTPVDPNDKCQNPHFKDAPFCQKVVFTRAGQQIPIFWKSRNIALNPLGSTVGSAVQLRTYDSAAKDQNWVFTPVNDFSDLYYITNADSKLALTANAYPSHLTLQNYIKAENQRFYVRGNNDGSFFISTFGSHLYCDAQEVNSGSLPILVVRNYEGDNTQRWLLN